MVKEKEITSAAILEKVANRKLETLTETVNEHHVAITELVEYRMRG
ncbi:hypothetical protein WJU16_22130 [Chitinophaga pollutisoli]|uniref:Uncharacterized protein n=1 Tax=Chitinophaga pollutisoli TaxID=3133966 RepID=A0ABZ2YLV1_9BACT